MISIGLDERLLQALELSTLGEKKASNISASNESDVSASPAWARANATNPITGSRTGGNSETVRQVGQLVSCLLCHQLSKHIAQKMWRQSVL